MIVVWDLWIFFGFVHWWVGCWVLLGGENLYIFFSVGELGLLDQHRSQLYLFLFCLNY